MKRSSFLVLTALVILAVSAGAFAQGRIVAPPSTQGLPNLRVHTHLYVLAPDGLIHDSQNPPPNAENPESLACVYGVTAPTSGCPRTGAPLPTGGSKAIAVVDYGHTSTLQSDFNAFNTQYGLPTQTLTFICDCGSCPNNAGTGWDLETALDVEYSHAMAPNAQIIVSEFCSDPFEGGMSAAEYKAGVAVQTAGGGEVSNSFSYNGGEDSGELAWDQWMNQPTVVYFSSADDIGLGPVYPSVSPNNISAGGTRIMRSGGNFTGQESCWTDSGGGISTIEPLPQYQLILGNKLGPHRGTPDWAADADPNSGAAVYSQTACSGWCQVGGTSLSSPLMAGILNQTGSFANHTEIELNKTYTYYRNPGIYRQYFYDVTTGNNGLPATVGWDQCTGLGTIRKPSGF